MIQKTITYFILGLAALALCSCAAFKPKLDKERAANVRKVALLSFEVHQQQPKDALGIGQMAEAGKRRSDSKELKKMSRRMFESLRKKMARKTGWKIASHKNLQNSPLYKKIYDKKMKGFRRASISAENTEVIFVDGVLDNVNFRSLSFQEKVALAKSVGANAFAEYVAYQRIDQGFSLGNLVGEASFQMINRSNLMVFGFDSEEPIWRVQNIDGDESQESDKLKGKLSVLQKLAKIGFESSLSSMDKMVDYYKR